jgi:uncharacterized protein (DUF58 family)
LRASDVALFLLYLLVFLFSPLRGLRVVALFFFGMHLLTVLPALLLPRALGVVRRDAVVRINRLQQLTVTLELRNRWPLPLRSVLVMDRPGGLFPDSPPVFAVSLRPRERRILTWTAQARERGEFTIGPVLVEGPGPLGLRRWTADRDALLRVIVYPAVFSLTLEHRRGLPAGNLAVLNRLYEDVSRFRSLREYAPGDEVRRINWKVSARLGKLHTTEYLPSLYFPVLVLLNLCSSDYPLSMRHHLMERAIEVAASLVVYFAGLKQEVGLAAAAIIPGQPGFISAPIRSGNSHGVRILESLALARPCDELVDFVSLVRGPAAGGGVVPRTGTRILAVTPPLSGQRRSALRSLTRRGWQLEVFFIGMPEQREDAPRLAGIADIPGITAHTIGTGEAAHFDG